MRVLFGFDIGFDRGGPSVHLLQDVLRAALNKGHDVNVILKSTGGPDKEMPEEFSANQDFHYTIIKDNAKKGGFFSRYLNEVKYAKQCGDIAGKQGKYDVVFLQSNVVAYFYMRKLRKLDCRIVFNVQDIFPYNLKFSGQLPMAGITFPIFRKLQNMAYKKADTIITISDDMKQTLVEDGVDADKIEVVYNWSYADTPITLESIDPKNVFDLHLDHSKFNVVYAGNIGKMQNVELVAETAIKMKENPNVHFYIIGDGANKAHIEEMTKGIDNITLLPMQPSRYAESIYAQADVNIIPLMPGGIKTALPSKTATVLRTNRPVVFCIDRNSLFSKKFSQAEGVYFSDCRLPDTLEMEIYSVMEKNNRVCSREQNSFIFQKNASEYIDIMIKIV